MSSNKRRYAQAQHRQRQQQVALNTDHKWPLFLRTESEVAVSWKALSELRTLPKNPVRLSLFLKVLTRCIAVDMPNAVERASAGRKSTQEERQLAECIAAVSDLIEMTRITRRNALLEQITLTDERYANEGFNMALALWLLGCQCNLLVHYLTAEQADSKKTGADFAAAIRIRDLVMYRTVCIMEYPMSALRMVVLRIVKLWTHLPILDDEFIEYLRLVRLRACELQCMAYERASHALDYPPWTKCAGKVNSTQYDRATLDMAKQFELYFYHLSRHIENERMFEQSAVHCNVTLCEAADRQHLYRWLLARTSEVFLDQWRREVVERAMLVELLPPEREVFRQSNPSANYDTKNVLKYMRSSRHDQINELLLANGERLVEREPVIAVLYEMLFLLQADAASFALDRYIYWVTDLPVEPDGCAYPAPTFFTNFDYPVIYCPLALSRFWVISDGKVLRCGTDVVFALALWLRIALGLTQQRPVYESLLALRFSMLRRCMLRDGYNAPVRLPQKRSTVNAGDDSRAAEPPPINAPLADLLQTILEAQRRASGHETRLAAATIASGPPVLSDDPAPTPAMMEF